MPRKVFLFLFCILGFIVVQAVVAAPDGGCGCDYTLPSGTWKLDGAAQNIQPGDVVCLEAGPRGNMRLENLHGTPANPIIIKNCGGQVVINTDSYGIAVLKSSNIRLTGSGAPAHHYGIRAGGTVGVGGLTTDVEVDHIEVFDAGFAGFMIKTDPDCDPATWRENFVMQNVSIHDNYAHGMDDGEGFYIGFTFYDGYVRNCNGVDTTVYGHLIENLEVYNNLTEDTGAEGIQIGSSPNASIHDNTVRLYGQRPFADYQNNGMQIGAGTTGSVYNNWIENGPGNGLIVLATGDLTFYNNVIKDTGSNGIFCDERSTPSTTGGFNFINNTIINSAEYGLALYADLVPLNHVKNNIIVNANEDYVRILNGNVDVEMESNLFANNVTDMKFVDAAGADYRLQVDSSAVETGMDVSSFGITADRAGTGRPYGDAYEIGAFEFLPTLRLSGIPSDQTIQLNWVFDGTLPPTATWRLRYDGITITDINRDLRTMQISPLINYAHYTFELDAMDGDTVLYSDTLTLFPTDQHIYLPITLK